MSKDDRRFLQATILIGMGLWGLCTGVEYSGWVLFFGILSLP